MPVHVFVGPTLAASAVHRIVPAAEIHDPVRHGDLLRLALGPGDVVVIVDGYYHQAAAVRHKEILHLLAGGVAVIGCGSMGALRAAELEKYGMIGHGVVFEMYRDGVIDGDDEVAVAHSEGPEYRRFSLPLVNVRYAARTAAARGVLSLTESADVVAAARTFPYTTRTWADLASVRPGPVAALREFLDGHPEYADRKAADAEDALSRLESLVRADARTKEWSTSPGWRNKFVVEWVAEHRGAVVEGFFVGDGLIARYRQIHDAGFPRLRRQYVLDAVAGTVGATPREAVVAAAGQGVTLESLSETQRADWLTRPEAKTLLPEEAMVRVLVRAHRPPHPTADLVAMLTEGAGTFPPEDRVAVAECLAVNAEVATWAADRQLSQLRFDTLRDHLAHVWRVDGHAELQATARDRGFANVGKAVAAVRPFYLRSHFTSLVEAQ